MPIEASQLILNDDGSVYHLHLRPEHIASTIITVGDPDRVSQVSKYFDKIEFQIQKREFVTHTGYIGKQRLTVISTGIGTDNIDIVFNELDALVNIDLETRTPKKELTSLRFIRVGTSGCLDPDIPIDALLVSRYAIGLDGLLHFYKRQPSSREWFLEKGYQSHLEQQGFRFPLALYAAEGQRALAMELETKGFYSGITLTAPGFYAPQMRQLRLPLALNDFFNFSRGYRCEGLAVTNFEMETSAIYGLASLMGHQAVSLNAIVAHRYHGQFSADGLATVEKLIQKTLEVVI